jgi:hypothetical protein
MQFFHQRNKIITGVFEFLIIVTEIVVIQINQIPSRFFFQYAGNAVSPLLRELPEIINPFIFPFAFSNVSTSSGPIQPL